ncbi:tetratricopeptide repeat protein [Flavobacterium sp. NST-5]|uniref:Tetratricopeptide repeat protein n=1 Tax=Flavobacterium ichthyis TaxID=2698827 RepID=A0ABW9ZBL5_9FLAO|nr:tetratricopeptide repeat protein [Flavobacterium ichthyis]NBL65510.1 tetratricopeptide repeat protein [Flavobacterium ichthyis]
MKYYLLILFFAIQPMQGQTSFEKARKLFDEGNFAQAKPLFEALVLKNPSDLKSIEYLGDIHSHQKNWSEAVTFYERLKNANPKHADYVYKYGGALGMKAKESNKFKALGMIDEVEESFLKAIQLDAKHIGARWALVELYLQLPAIIGGSEKKAQKFSTQLMTISPVDGYLSKGHIDEYFKRYTSAEKHYKKAVEIGGSKTTYQKLADLYKNKMNQPEKAKLLLEEFNEKNKI